MSKMLLRLRQEQSWDVKNAVKTGARVELGMLKMLLKLRRAELGPLKMLIRLRQEQSWGY